ncbi:MAG: DUF192 domain-containing protein [Gaiellaceae bacterium MAG52_C11]|nr:DUF192 domain-containing protein [Candidatus Gaiellasilicea maunaloa]
MRGFLVFLLVASTLALGARFAPEGALAFTRGTATVSTGNRQIVLQVERARTTAARAQGLMGRRSLGPRAGMVFEYARPTAGAFWMKNTLIPLDIAFYDGRGRILRTFTMTPCRTDDCPLYDPEVAFRGALEVNAGSFRRWGVKRGDRIVVRTR